MGSKRPRVHDYWLSLPPSLSPLPEELKIKVLGKKVQPTKMKVSFSCLFEY